MSENQQLVAAAVRFNKSITDTTERFLRDEITRLEDLILRVDHCCVGRESCDGSGPHEAMAEAEAIRERRKRG